MSIPGLDPEDGDEAVGTQNDARLKMYENIANNADDVRLKAGDLAERPDGDLSDFTDPDIEAANAEHPDPAVSRETVVKHKVKINGQEREFTTDELIATAGKVAAADDYLKQAKDAAELAARLREQPIRQPSQDVDEGEEDPLALARAIQMGSEEEAAAAIQKLRATKSPSIDVDVIARQTRDRMRFEDAGEWVKTEYADLFADEDLRGMFLQRDQALVQSQDNRDYRERYKAIGDELRAKFKPGSPQKEQRKSATIVNLPTASARAVAPVEDDSEEDTTSVIRQMAKARGQTI